MIKSAYLKLIVTITHSIELSIRNVQLQNRKMTNFPLSLILLNIVLEKLSIVILNKRDANIEKGKIICDFLQNVIYELHEEAGDKEGRCILIGLS